MNWLFPGGNDIKSLNQSLNQFTTFSEKVFAIERKEVSWTHQMCLEMYFFYVLMQALYLVANLQSFNRDQTKLLLALSSVLPPWYLKASKVFTWHWIMSQNLNCGQQDQHDLIPVQTLLAFILQVPTTLSSSCSSILQLRANTSLVTCLLLSHHLRLSSNIASPSTTLLNNQAMGTYV